MPTVSVELRNVADTEAALGWAGAHTIVVDRPEGHAGGHGLGFNGAQLLALTIGGCFCNDLRWVAHATGNVELGTLSISVAVELEGDPILATAATCWSTAKC
jgi:organic hydroperoxide reductase OsmC/OhrA